MLFFIKMLAVCIDWLVHEATVILFTLICRKGLQRFDSRQVSWQFVSSMQQCISGKGENKNQFVQLVTGYRIEAGHFSVLGIHHDISRCMPFSTIASGASLDLFQVGGGGVEANDYRQN